MTSASGIAPLTVVVLAPHGRDALLAQRLVQEAGLAGLVVADLPGLIDELRHGAGMVVVTEEALANSDLSELHALIASQPPWADIPILLLIHRGGGLERNPIARRLSGSLGNVSFLERPFHPTTFLSLVEAGLRSRRRQYEARDRLDELHAAEEALREANAGLERRVMERTEELKLAEANFRQSQKMEAVGQLTGGLAHDFNNLLAGISGSLEFVESRMRQGRLKDIEKYVVAAQGAAKRAAALTHRLLAFSRQQTLAPKATDVNGLIRGMLELVQRTVGPGIEIQHIGAAGLWPALVDGPQLENGLLNLCINARDAMPDGGRITIETGNRWIDRSGGKQQGMAEGQYLSLCVSDTGTGMTPDVMAKAFDPFFTTKPIGQGTGLGLSMIYGFARQSGGQVRIYSELGQGTMVCIYLPRHRGEVEEDAPASEGTDSVTAEAGETVLVVDDEPSVRMLVVDTLEDLGYTALEARDGASGLRMLQSNTRIDLLVTDVGLPGGMNGRQMADVARVSRPGLKVLFITGFAENALLANGQLEPGMSVITKPFAMDTLAARLRELIAK